jgi:hypothetical protein
MAPFHLKLAYQTAEIPVCPVRIFAAALQETFSNTHIKNGE